MSAILQNVNRHGQNDVCCKFDWEVPTEFCVGLKLILSLKHVYNAGSSFSPVLVCTFVSFWKICWCLSHEVLQNLSHLPLNHRVSFTYGLSRTHTVACIHSITLVICVTHRKLALVWMFLLLPKVHVEALTPTVMVLGGLWKMMRSWAWDPPGWDQCPCKRSPREPPTPPTMWGHRENVVYEPGWGQQQRLYLPAPWTYQPPELWGLRYAVYSLPHLNRLGGNSRIFSTHVVRILVPWALSPPSPQGPGGAVSLAVWQWSPLRR